MRVVPRPGVRGRRRTRPALVHVVGDGGHHQLGAQLDVGKPITRNGFDVVDLRTVGGGGELRRVQRLAWWPRLRHHLDDVGLAGGDREQLGPAATNEVVGGLGRWTGLGVPSSPAIEKYSPEKLEQPVAEETLEHGEVLLEARDADSGSVQPDPRLVVFGVPASRWVIDLYATARHHVERGKVLGKHCGVAEVMGENGLRHTQCGRRIGHCGAAIRGKNGMWKWSAIEKVE